VKRGKDNHNGNQSGDQKFDFTLLSHPIGFRLRLHFYLLYPVGGEPQLRAT
jgi:hypothetical protein